MLSITSAVRTAEACWAAHMHSVSDVLGTSEAFQHQQVNGKYSLSLSGGLPSLAHHRRCHDPAFVCVALSMAKTRQASQPRTSWHLVRLLTCC